jgi:hypothetical protein
MIARFIALAIGAIHAAIGVTLLFMLQVIVQAFSPDWELPFSYWWGAVLCLPCLVITCLPETHSPRKSVF